MRNVSNSPFLDSSTTNYTNGSHASSTHGQINPRSHNSSTSADPPNNNTQWGNVSHSVPACQYCGRCDHTAKTCYKLHGIGTPLIIISTKQICHNMITVLIPIGCLICVAGFWKCGFRLGLGLPSLLYSESLWWEFWCFWIESLALLIFLFRINFNL